MHSDELKRITKRETLQVRDLIKEEEYEDFIGQPLNLLAYVLCELQVGDSYVKKARVLVARNRYKSIIGREWLSTLRHSFTQEKSELEVNSIDKDEELSEETKQFEKKFPKLFVRRGKNKNYQVKINPRNGARTTQQKGRENTNSIAKSFEEKMKCLLKEGHIKRVAEIKDDVFIQPTVITVKKDRSVKIALDARALNHAIDRDKYQMPNLENLLDMVAEKLDTKNGEPWCSSVDMTHAYGQIPLHQLTAKHCNFQIIGVRQQEYIYLLLVFMN